MQELDNPDLQHIATPMDFLGINYYPRSVASAAGTWDARNSGLELTEMGWEIYPEGLTELLLRLHRDYPVPPLYVTENGCADSGDSQRPFYLLEHVRAVGTALGEGLDLRGYLHWSLTDNYEWGSFAPRFGLFQIDFHDDRRERMARDELGDNPSKTYADWVRRHGGRWH